MDIASRNDLDFEPEKIQEIRDTSSKLNHYVRLMTDLSSKLLALMK